MQSQEDTASEMRHNYFISARGSNFSKQLNPVFYFGIMGYILHEYYHSEGILISDFGIMSS